MEIELMFAKKTVYSYFIYNNKIVKILAKYNVKRSVHHNKFSDFTPSIEIVIQNCRISVIHSRVSYYY